jgi:hypothetical protein
LHVRKREEGRKEGRGRIMTTGRANEKDRKEMWDIGFQELLVWKFIKRVPVQFSTAVLLVAKQE